MLEIISTTDCGNSPKAQLLKDWNIAFAKGDTGFLLEKVTEDINWQLVGDRQIEGKIDFAAALQKMKTTKAVKLRIDHVITHGKAGSVNGMLLLEDGKRYAFCDVYTFKNARAKQIKAIASYVILIE